MSARACLFLAAVAGCSSTRAQEHRPPEECFPLPAAPDTPTDNDDVGPAPVVIPESPWWDAELTVATVPTCEFELSITAGFETPVVWREQDGLREIRLFANRTVRMTPLPDNRCRITSSVLFSGPNFQNSPFPGHFGLRLCRVELVSQHAASYEATRVELARLTVGNGSAAPSLPATGPVPWAPFTNEIICDESRPAVPLAGMVPTFTAELIVDRDELLAIHEPTMKTLRVRLSLERR